MNKLLLGMASLSLLLAAGIVRADDKPPADDKEFLMRAITGNHAEIKFAELAEKRAANEKVKMFAAQMIKDHTAANEKLTDHAKNQKVAVAAGFERDKRDTYMELSKLNGADFDRAYMKLMVENHEKSVKLYEHQAKMGMDPELKKAAEELLPKVQMHLMHAKEINELVSK